jgi:hypothetical protein
MSTLPRQLSWKMRSCNTLKVIFEGPPSIGLSQSRELDNYLRRMNGRVQGKFGVTPRAGVFFLFDALGTTTQASDCHFHENLGHDGGWEVVDLNNCVHSKSALECTEMYKSCFTCNCYRSLFADRGHNERVVGYSLTGKLTKTPFEVDVLVADQVGCCPNSANRRSLASILPLTDI